MSEKDDLVHKLRTNVKLLKDKVRQKTENSDLVNIYEQQLNEKDELIEVELKKNIRLRFHA